VPTLDPKIARGRAMRSQVVRDPSDRNEAIFRQEFARQLSRSAFVSLGRNQRIEDLAFRVDGAS
jgi:hypothetical protein